MLDQKGLKLKEGAILMQKDAKELESITWWKNCKLTAIIIIIIIAIILVIALPIIFSAKSAAVVSGITGGNSTNTTGSKLLFQ